MLSLEPKTTDFFVLRSPRVSHALLEELPASNTGLDDVLQRFVDEPIWQEALYLASPSLIERACREFSEHKMFMPKTRMALLKYLIRMTSRSTPFGLFASVSLGRFADQTDLELGNGQKERKVSRLDMEYLCRLRQYLSQHSALLTDLLFKLNPTFYLMGDTGHYIEPYHTLNQQQYRLSAVEVHQVLARVCQLAVQPQKLTSLVQEIKEDFRQYSSEELIEYLKALVRERVLLPELPLPLTGSKTELAFIQCLTGLEAIATDPILATIPERLAEVVDNLRQIDGIRGAAVHEYQSIGQKLQLLPCTTQENKLIQVDLFRPLQRNQLSKSVKEPLARVLLALHASQPPVVSPFTDFINRFQRRFEGQAVPLLAVLNEENGISFSSETTYETPLLAGVRIRMRINRTQTGSNSPTASFARWLDYKILENHNGSVLQLYSDQLLSEQSDLQSLWSNLPMSFSTIVSIYKLNDEGGALVHLHNASGPSGANLLGRFCHLDEELLSNVKQFLSDEQKLCSDVLLAELVHTPDGRPGNVIARPHLRPDEIVFLADSELPEHAKIDPSDLFVYVEENKVKLWSKSRQKQVLPRLTCAHNFTHRSLGIYRFLAMLSHQYGTAPAFTMPNSWQQASRVPRVMIDEVVVSEASWLVPRERLTGLLDGDRFNEQAWEELQVEFQLDDWVKYAIGDHVLTIKLTHVPMLNVLLQESRQLTSIRLTEVLGMKYPSLATGPDGRYFHELVLPWLNPSSKLPTSLGRPVILTNQGNRRFGAGSEWLSVKLYGSASQVELLLLQLAPLFNQWQQQARIDGWFFIRYGDPDWHLRVRFHGIPTKLCQLLPEMWQLLQSALNWQQLHKLELFTYEQEQERYGGPIAIKFAEELFCLDSQFVTTALQFAAEKDDRWRVRAQVAVVFSYLNAFILDYDKQLLLLSQLRTAFGKEFQENVQLRQQFGQKFRDYQVSLNQDFLRKATDADSLQLYLLLDQFQRQVEPIASRFKALATQNELTVDIPNLLSSLLHMSLNRLSKAYGREQELVVYDFCRRLLLARQQRKSND